MYNTLNGPLSQLSKANCQLHHSGNRLKRVNSSIAWDHNKQTNIVSYFNLSTVFLIEIMNLVIIKFYKLVCHPTNENVKVVISHA